MSSDHIEIKLEISNRKTPGNFTDIRTLNNIPLNVLWIKEEIKKVNEEYFELGENENMTHQNWCNAA